MEVWRSWGWSSQENISNRAWIALWVLSGGISCELCSEGNFVGQKQGKANGSRTGWCGGA